MIGKLQSQVRWNAGTFAQLFAATEYCFGCWFRISSKSVTADCQLSRTCSPISSQPLIFVLRTMHESKRACKDAANEVDPVVRSFSVETQSSPKVQGLFLNQTF